MLVALTLSDRQSQRVLAQALRTRAKLEIDPRPLFLDAPLWATLVAQENGTLVVNLMQPADQVGGTSLAGAMCDARMILSDQLYLFSTAILELNSATAPPRLVLAAPDELQIANRRRFQRRSPAEPVPVRMGTKDNAQLLVGNLVNISRMGLACRVPRQTAEDWLFIGDSLAVEFVLPWANQVFSLPAVVCAKNTCVDETSLSVGVEFVAADATARATLELLRVALDNETQRLIETDGDA